MIAGYTLLAGIYPGRASNIVSFKTMLKLIWFLRSLCLASKIGIFVKAYIVFEYKKLTSSFKQTFNARFMSLHLPKNFWKGYCKQNKVLIRHHMIM